MDHIEHSYLLWKSHLSAKTLVFGMDPLNSTAPDGPGKNKSSESGNSWMTKTKLANSPSTVLINGQNEANGQQGTIRVPLMAHTRACQMTLGMRAIGGHHKFNSSAQFTVKASTASEPGFQQRLLNLGS